MRIILCYSKETPDFPWRVELQDQMVFAKRVVVKAESETLVRSDKTPTCVLEIYGQAYWNDADNSIVILPSRSDNDKAVGGLRPLVSDRLFYTLTE